MKLHSFDECAVAAKRHVDAGRTIFQQFNCAHCGVKQTIEDANKFFTHGICEECGGDTDIKKDGCNYMMIVSFK